MRTRAELNATLLDATAAHADLDVVMTLLRAGADLECSLPPQEGGFRPLHLALRGARQRSPELVSALLGAGADPNARASGGQTPLHVALGTTERPWSEESASVKSLINAGADPNIGNRLGHTPLMYAASHTYDAVGILLAAGADLVARDCDGWTALEWAIASGLTTDPLTRAVGKRSDYAKEEEFLQRETPRDFDPEDGGNIAVLPALSARVADYLASGYALLEYAPPDGCWTDGVWAWRDSAIATARMAALRLPGAFLARMESAQYRVPFLDPMKLYVKTGLYLSATGGTYLMRRSQFEYLHAHFCRFPDVGPTEQLEIASTISAAKPFKYEAPANLSDSATPEIARLREVVGATTSLRSRFDEGARLTLAEALDLMHGLLYALDEIHTGLIIHRNLHPGCVLVDEAGGVTLTGFELAVGPGLPPRSWNRVEMSGALVTMSPEQIQGTGCDARSDLFQAAVIFYQMLTGEPPFAGSGAWSKAEKILREDPAPPSSVNSAIPVSLDGVLARALAKDPSQRYQRAAEFAGALVRAVPELHTVLRASNSPLAKLSRLANKLARAWERASHLWR